MIEVMIHRKENKVSSFTLSGHAESGPYGYDLVCAAVSAVSFGAVNGVTELCDISLDIEQGERGGFLSVTLPDDIDEKTWAKASFLFDAMIISLQTIEREYSQFIQITEK